MKTPKKPSGEWDYDKMNKCKECEGAMLVMPRCSIHGGTPLQTYWWMSALMNMPEWECKECGEKGKSESGEIPYTHVMSHKPTHKLDISSCHTLPS
tara:strand:+ start:191 stop:478 length:288 start_codon:yes stop_codon:yes gene_type:complete